MFVNPAVVTGRRAQCPHAEVLAAAPCCLHCAMPCHLQTRLTPTAEKNSASIPAWELRQGPYRQPHLP